MTKRTAEQKFNAAARRLWNQILKVAGGDRDLEVKARRALDNLYARYNREMLALSAGTAARADATVTGLHRALNAASDAGRNARSNTLAAACRELKAAEQAAKPLPGTYAHELALLK